MAEHYEQLPEGKGFPTPEDVARWQQAFADLVPGGNASELVGFKFVEGEAMAVCQADVGDQDVYVKIPRLQG